MMASAHEKGPPSSPWTAPKSTSQFNFTGTDAVEQFRNAMREAGIEPPEVIEQTGDRPKRFATNGKRKDDAGWYVYHEDGIPAGAFGDFRTGADFTWRMDIGRALTPTEEAVCRQRETAAKAARQAEQEKLRANAATLANALLAAGKPATAANPYLTRKGINTAPANAVTLLVPDVTAVLGYGPKSKGEALTGEILVLPVVIDGEITTAELIDEDGRKSVVYGGAKAGGAWTPAPIPRGAEIVAIGEGAATVLSVAEATGWPVVAALSAGNLPAIARQVRTAHPAARVVILADLIKSTREPNPHAIEAATAVGGLVAVPSLSSEEGTDWNDFAAVRGLDAVRTALLEVASTAPSVHPAEVKAMALREAVNLAEAIADPVARALALADVGRDHLGTKAPAAPAAFIEAAERGARRVFPVAPPSLAALAASAEERAAAKLTPRAIVRYYLYADVALLSAAGGTGKTTLKLKEAVHILTGRPLYGLEIEAPGPVIFITAEDPRPVILARLHRVIEAMDPPLSQAELAAVDAGFIVWDVSADLCRLADIDASGRIMPTGFADEIITAAKPINPALIVLDPIVSFMPGESRVNDVEQALIVEARRIVRALDCGVQFITHVSQNAARGGTLDQYASRGGTALADGARMVSVLAPWKPGDHDDPPVTLDVPAGASVLKLARPKLSYAPPQPLIWLARDGYRFDYTLAAPPQAADATLRANADQVYSFIAAELKLGRKYSKVQLVESRDQLNMRRDPIRAAIAELEISRRIVHADLPADECRGGRKTFLNLAECCRQEGQ
jgi:RecA-family ATPase/phage/plasmid primase-like uncharacterized protein